LCIVKQFELRKEYSRSLQEPWPFGSFTATLSADATFKAAKADHSASFDQRRRAVTSLGVQAAYSGICAQCLEFGVGSRTLGEALGAARGSKSKHARGLVFGVAVQGQFATIEIDLADLALFSLCVGIVCGDQQRLWRRLPEKKADDRRRPFCHVDLLCFGELAWQIFAGVHNVKPERRVGAFGIKLTRLSQIGQRVGQPTGVQVCDAAVEIGLGIFRVELDRLGVFGDGAVIVALMEVGVAAVVVGVGIFRVEPDRVTIVGDGAVEIALLVVREAATGIGLRKFRVKPDCLAVVGDGSVVVSPR
jgi:hypothetical protein